MPARSWWQRTVDNVKQAAESTISWIDQHQVEVAIGLGVVVGVTTIILTAGTATPLVVAGLTALAAGGTAAVASGLGTVGLNAYYDRPLTQNVLRNAALSFVPATAIVGGYGLLTSGLATQAVLRAGGAVGSLCLQFPTTCTKLEPALQLLDTAEQVWLSAQLAVQTATNDPRAPETALELQLEYMDGGVPGNTAIRRLEGEVSEAGSRHAEEVLDAAAGVVNRYGDDAVRLIEIHGNTAIEFFAAHEDEAFSLLSHHGEDIVAAFGRYGDEGISVAEQYGLPFVRRSEQLGIDPTSILRTPPTSAQTPEGWLLGVADGSNPVNQPLRLNLSAETIDAVAETSVHNPDSVLFSIGFGGRPGVVPYDEVGRRHGIGYFGATDETWDRFVSFDAMGDFWQVNSRAIEIAMAERKIFVLNVPYDVASDATDSFTSAELRLIETGDYELRTVGDVDILVPNELLDSYLAIVRRASPDLFGP
jgi:hypothetical protein